MNGTIDHRPDRPKPWRARYLAPNGSQPSRSFVTKIEAQQWLRGEIMKIDQDDWSDPNGGKIKYASHAADWLDGLLDIKEKTRAGYEGLLRSRVLPAFGDTQLRHIKPPDVRAWIASMNEEGLSPSRIRQARQVLRASLDVAIDDRLIVRNPAAGTKLPSDRPRQMTVLTPQQVNLLAEVADRHLQGSGTLITFLAYTGLRWGEAAALTVDSVDLLHRRVRVRASATEIGGRIVVGSPKTHRERTIILPSTVASLLDAHLEIGGRSATDLVFTTPTGTVMRSSNFGRRVWKPTIATLAKTYPRLGSLRVHDLRHTAASLAISCGGNIKAVQTMLGHRRASTTLDVYGHLYVDDLEDLADRLEDRLRGVA